VWCRRQLNNKSIVVFAPGGVVASAAYWLLHMMWCGVVVLNIKLLLTTHHMNLLVLV
jgi:hypothetical protein